MYLKSKIIIILFLSIQFNVYSQSLLELKKPITITSKELLSTGDYFYQNQKYLHSILYYEYLYFNNYSDINIPIKPRLLLNYLRLKERYNKTIDTSLIQKLLLENNSNLYTVYYIDLYASFRFGYNSFAFVKINKILQSDTISEDQKDYAKLIFGSLYFEENLNEVEKYYTKLAKETKNQEVKNISLEILKKTNNFNNNFSKKNPWVAGILSIFIPGSGYFYTHHYTDGLLSLFWNSVFIGGGIYMYQLEKNNNKNHIISYGFLIMGLSVYISNIIGSYTSAIRYNNYKLRIFYRELRNLYFNTDFIERTSGIQFEFKY